jgi:hypothetical protein
LVNLIEKEYLIILGRNEETFGELNEIDKCSKDLSFPKT